MLKYDLKKSNIGSTPTVPKFFSADDTWVAYAESDQMAHNIQLMICTFHFSLGCIRKPIKQLNQNNINIPLTEIISTKVTMILYILSD